MDTKETLERCNDWARLRYDDIIKLLPFNPVIAKRAFHELIYPERAGNWEEISNLFKVDPGLMAKFYERSRQEIRQRGKKGRVIRNIADAIAVLGLKTTVEVLQAAMSDEIILKLSKVPFTEMQFIWKESWGIGYGAENLSQHTKLNSTKAFHIGLLSDVGMLIMAQLYKAEYFLKTDPLLQEESEDKYEFSGKERLDLEERHFGINHTELGFWLVDNFGLELEYSLPILHHESDIKQLDEKEMQDNRYIGLINASRLISRYILIHDKFKLLHKDTDDYTKYIEARSIVERRWLLRLINTFDKLYDIPAGESEKLIANVELEVKNQSKRISGKISLLDEKDFLEALMSVGENRDKALKVFSRLIEADVGKYLPHPVAICKTQISNPKNTFLEYPSLLTKLLNSFTRILCSMSLSFLYNLCKDDEKEFYREIKNLLKTNFNNKSSIFCDMGTGVSLCESIAKRLLSEDTAEDSISRKFASYITNNSEELYWICKKRAQTKSKTLQDYEHIINKITYQLRVFSNLSLVFYAVTDIQYSKTKKGPLFSMHLLNWNDTKQLDLREQETVKNRTPFVTSQDGLQLLDKKTQRFQFLQNFLIYDKCYKTKKHYFYGAESIMRIPVTVKLLPFTEDNGVSYIIWPANKEKI